MLSPQVSGSPPSIFNVTPVMKLLVMANSTAPDTSSVVPMRRAGLLLHEPGRYPVAYFPRGDVESDVLTAEDRVTQTW
jgi:uncharacterized protein (DUF427 family)